MKRADWRFRTLTALALAASAATATVTAQVKRPAPLSIARQGYLFAGGMNTTREPI